MIICLLSSRDVKDLVHAGHRLDAIRRTTHKHNLRLRRSARIANEPTGTVLVHPPKDRISCVDSVDDSVGGCRGVESVVGDPCKVCVIYPKAVEHDPRQGTDNIAFNVCELRSSGAAIEVDNRAVMTGG